MFSLLEKADSIEQQPNEKGRIRIANRKRSHDLLMPYRKNVFAGGNWHFRRGRMTEALSLFRTYIDVSETPLFEADNLLYTDTLMPDVAYLAVHAAHQTQQHELVIRYTPLALKADTQQQVLLELLSKAYLAKEDTANYIGTLWGGMHVYPEHTYFYSHLVDHLIEEREYEQGLEVTDSMINWCDTIPLFHYAKSLLLLKMNRDDDAIKAADACIELDPNYADAYYNKGIASLNLAVDYAAKACTDLTNPQCKRDMEIIRSLYLLAKQPMEMVRKLQPDNPERWATHLYRIYLHLNMGKEFDEMDRILH